MQDTFLTTTIPGNQPYILLSHQANLFVRKTETHLQANDIILFFVITLVEIYPSY